MSSRKITDLHPNLQPKCRAFLGLCAEAGIPVMLTCTYRSQAEQDALYAQGRTTPGRKVTWTRFSRHSNTINGKPAATAFDIAILSDGKPTWDLKVDVNKDSIPDYQNVGKIGERLGLEWGGRWKSPDYPHFQLEV